MTVTINEQCNGNIREKRKAKKGELLVARAECEPTLTIRI